MGLLHNTVIQSAMLGRRMTALEPQLSLTGLVRPERKNMLKAFDPVAGIPNGHLHPSSWALPRVSGGMSAYTTVSGTGGASGVAYGGVNLEATVSGSGGITDAALQLIVSMVATLSGSGGISVADLRAYANLSATLAGSGNVTAAITGLADLAAALVGSGGASATPSAIGHMSATIRGYGELTPEGIRDAIWRHQIDGYSADDLLKLLLSYAANETEIQPLGNGQAIVKFKDPSGVKDRLTAYMTGSVRTQVDKDVS